MWSLFNVWNNLYATDTKITAMKLFGLFFDPFVNCGVMFASFHSE